MIDESKLDLHESAKAVYNSYLLLYKLNELKDDGGKSLRDVISEAVGDRKTQTEFKINDKLYTVNITEDGKLKVLGEYTKPEVQEVKEVQEYTNEDVIALWANSEVSFERDNSNNLSFAAGLHDEFRSQDLKIGGSNKKVPFALRFANFYKIIEILNDQEISLQEKLRLANNIATGSGKTGDIALLKFWCYLANIPCITLVPNEMLRVQSNNFEKAFLPDEIALEFGQTLSEHNTQYATTTFEEALDAKWSILNSKYGENGELALIIIDEAPELKRNAVQMVRGIEVARHNPIVYSSATPDSFLSEKFGIKKQILLSPKERVKLGIGKSLKVFYKIIEQLTLQEKDSRSAKSENYISPAQEYVLQDEITHSIIGNSLQQKFKNYHQGNF
ncbi:DEAD/DEAH box helicase family protein [Wolbachia endosymbiont of Ctenocephalides felis wCfeT]|uniref:hypothetical protein n=1 Tax=Wolbachia endosymbiont of Ctenocephalides felis wCfeT TaxID=2732593 RepID=UPI001448363B|nr:hypothetical protein [Wolbachia endosymbiont of Ctenocephalides felis wCfeT]